VGAPPPGFSQAKNLKRENLRLSGSGLVGLTPGIPRKCGKESVYVKGAVNALEDTLAAVHPRNIHIRPKTQQQLQVLRDLGIQTFLGNGSYRLR
jgi:hypothetical protein